MSTQWRVWCPTDGETIDDSRVWTEADAEDAASTHVQDIFDGGDPFTEMTVYVREISGGPTPTFSVTVVVDYSPSFTARRPTEVPCHDEQSQISTSSPLHDMTSESPDPPTSETP